EAGSIVNAAMLVVAEGKEGDGGNGRSVDAVAAREAQQHYYARLKRVPAASLISDGATIHTTREQGSGHWQRRERTGRSGSWKQLAAEIRVRRQQG
ncbi:hypothetical protein GW17_00005425, partial [Ensete ventricosum]